MQKTLPGNRLGRWLAGGVLALLATLDAQAQLTGTKTIPGSYATLAAAITDLNTQGVGTGGVTFNIAAGYTETAANLLITATGTAANPIVFQKSGAGANPLLTAGVGTSTTLDAVIGLSGADYVTIDGIDVAENPANTTATTQMEFGYALFRASATDGSQFNIIRNCVVTLAKTNVNTIGIYGSAASATAITATSAAGGNSGNKVYGNVVTNALTGIYFAAGSSTTIANYDQNNEIGVTAGNTIGNFGGTASGWGAGGTYQNGLKVTGNTINSTLNYTSATASTPVAASTVTSTLRGIYTPSGTSSNLDITSNTITLASGATTSQLSGIENSMGNTPASNTVNITRNTLSISYLTATSATVYGFYNNGSPATLNITGNTLANTTLSNTGSTYFIYNNHSATAANVLNNQLGGVTRTGASGTVYGYYNNGSGAGTHTLTGNVITNVSVAGSSTFYGLYNTSASAETQLWSANQITNITATATPTGPLYGIYNTYGAAGSQFFNNTITGLSGGGTVYGLNLSNTGLAAAAAYGNTIGALSSTGTSSSVYGLYTSVTTPTIYRNKIYGLSGTGTGAAIYGLYTGGGTTVTLYNNLIGDLQAPAATGLTAVSGMYFSTATAINAYYNSIYLAAASNGATFGTAGIYFSTSPTALDLRNNIVVNKSTAAGTGGYTAALRRASGTAGTAPAALATTSNNNLYYAGTPSATNLIYVEGTTTATNAAQTLADYKGLVSPRESFSQTEDVAFLSTAGTAATFLHLNPAVPTLAEGKAQPISSITTDFDNDTRDATTPDIGADEGAFTTAGAAVDIAATGLVAPSAAGCYGAAESVVVSIRNNGTQALNFATTPATVTVAVTGATTQTLTFTVNTGTLAVGASQNVTVGPLNMSAGGTYSFAITASVPGDGDATNNSTTASRLKVALATGAQQVSFTGFTGANLTTLYPGWYEATGATLPTGTTSTWTSDDYANVVNGPNGISAKINLYSNTRLDWIVSPRVLATASSVLTYDLALTAFGLTTAGTLGSDDRLEVRVSTDCGTTFTTLKAYTAATPISNTGQSESVSLANYAGQEIIVAFFATEGTVDDSNDNDVFIDNINLNPQGIDLAPTALVAPLTGQSCYGTAEAVTVSVRNSGLQTIDFAVNPATVTVAVTGAATQTLTGTVSTGTLAAGASQNVTVTPLNMSAAGTYTFAITATVTGDQSTGNDVLGTQTRTVTAPVAGTLAPAASSLCVSGTVTLTLTGSANGSIQWQQSTDNVTFTDISGATSATYTTPVLTSLAYFRARTGCNTTVVTSNVATITINNPQVTATNSPVAICAGSTATLTATGSAGTTLRFFDVATGGTALATGGTFTTPALTASQQYFVEAATGGTESMGRPAPAATTATTASTYGLVFTAAAPFTLASVDVYPTSTAGNLVVQVQDNAGVLIPGLTATVAIPAGTAGTPYTVPLNFNIPAGTGLRLMAINSPLLIRESAVGGFPYTSPSGTVSITSGYILGTSTSYYFFYNWQVSTLCTGTRTPIQVNVSQPATATFSYPATGSNCAGSTGTVAPTLTTGATAGAFTSTTGLTLNATTGAVNLATSAAGTYTVTNTVAAAGSCGAVTATAILTVNPTPARPTLTPTYNGTVTTLTSSAATGNQFYFNGNLIPGATGQTYVVNGAATTYGSYTVVVTNSFGCSSAASVATVVTTTRAGIAGASLLVYPNPTPTGQVTLELSGFRSATQLAVIDALGRVVRSETLPATTGVVTHQLNLSGMASGVYMLRLTNADGVETRRLVRE